MLTTEPFFTILLGEYPLKLPLLDSGILVLKKLLRCNDDLSIGPSFLGKHLLVAAPFMQHVNVLVLVNADVSGTFTFRCTFTWRHG